MRDNRGRSRTSRSFCAPTARALAGLALLALALAPAGEAVANPPPAAKPSPAVTAWTTAPGGATAAPPPVDDASCASCHAGMLQRKFVHAAMSKQTCSSCHKPTQRVGKCKSPSASSWGLTKPQGELCAACHDAQKIASPFKVKHDFKGRCVECHDAHGSDRPHLMVAEGKKLCLSCHDSRSGKREVTRRIDLTRKNVHRALDKKECQDCHEAGHGGAARQLLKKEQPELCYGCHDRLDQSKVVHTAIRQGECLECHEAHSSSLPALMKRPKEQLCTSCHETEPLLSKTSRHAPVAEGRCLECHGPHGGERPFMVLGTGKALCLKCHDAKAPTGRGAASDGFRIDFTKAVTHKAVKDGECTDCHAGGHSSDQPRMLKKAPPDLCYGCHNRKDAQRFTHGAVKVGDCTGCHKPHVSDHAKLLTQPTKKETCFGCHNDDLTGRAVMHKPAAEGKCDECHAPHGSPNRWLLTKGDGKNTCYSCHRPVDGGKVKHPALERYGCTGCHDPHGTANRFLLAKKVNDLCIGCHEAQKDGFHVTRIAAGNGHVLSGLLDPRRPDRDFSCASCHNPHGSDNPKLFYSGATPMEACDGCHGNKSGKNPGAVSVIHRARPPEPQQTGSAGGASGAGGESLRAPSSRQGSR